MKQILHFLAAMLFAASGLMAQGYNVSVSGTVTDTNFQPVANHPVHISTDSVNSPVVTVVVAYTASNGTYQATMTVPSMLPPNIIVSTPNCNANMLVQFFQGVTQPVVANFTICVGPPPPPCSNNFNWTSNLQGSTFTFAGQVMPQGPATYAWNFGDGSSGTGQVVQHTYQFTGIYTVTLTTQSGGCTATSSQVVMVGQPPACQAMFTGQPTAGNALTIAFSNLSSAGPNANYHWTFGDGTGSNQVNPVHTYLQAGVYAVCLTVIDSSANCFDVFCDSILVGNVLPGNCPSGFNKQVSGNTVAFNGFMQNPSVNATYVWDFGDNTTGTGQNVTHTYAQPGSYMVCLTTTTALNCTFTSCQQVIVGATPGCQAHFNWMPDSTGTGIVFFNNSMGNPTQWHWTFGDGTSSNLQHPGVHFYNGPGPYVVCLTISNNTVNCQSTFCDTVFMLNPNCQGYFTHSSMPANALTVTFNGFAAMPNAGFQWDFGDGTFGAGQNVTHTYLQGGLKQVCMKIIGFGLQCPPHCQTIQVGGPNPTVPSIAGVVMTFNTPADFGRVFLIQYDSIANTLTALDTVPLDSNGFFFFSNVPFGKYLLKAALTPASASYSGYMPTYYGNSLTWDYAQYVHKYPNTPPVFVQIPLIAGANPGGPGFIGGNVLTGANKLIEGGKPVEGVQVTITDLSGNPVAYAMSDANGNFSIPNLALTTYMIFAEIPGLISVPGIISLTTSSWGVTNIQITVTSTQVTTGFGNVSESIEFIGQVFPNPTDGEVSIEIGVLQPGDIMFKVFDQSGRLVASFGRELEVGIGKVEFNLENLAPGYYIMTIQNPEGVNIARKFMRM